MTNLILAKFEPSLFTKIPCLADQFYGIYGGESPVSLFVASNVCYEQLSSSSLAEPLLLSFPNADGLEGSQLVWIEEQAIDDKLRSQTFESSLDALVERLSIPTISPGQEVLASQGVHSLEWTTLYQGPTSALISINSHTALHIDTQLPPFLKSSLIPPSPISYQPVPSDAIDRINDLLETMKFDPDVASIINSMSVEQMRNDIRYLSGEDSDLVSRHSFAPGSRVAAEWLKQRFEGTGATCEFRKFLVGFAPNVICSYPSLVKTTATVIISAHYDSRGSFGSTRAPGANDDGSGVTGLLAIARTIAHKGIAFKSNVQLVAFAGEEQGLLGSRAYARELRQLDANITLMIQADMTAYHAPDEPAQLGFPQSIGTPEVTQLVANATTIYSPELMIGVTPACCSDHQSFHEQGFPATQVFERAGPIADPMYHNSGDLSAREGYDLHQVKSIAKAQFATLLHAAGFTLPKARHAM